MTVLATLGLIVACAWGRRFVVPVVAGFLLALLLVPLVARATRVLRSRVAATLLSIATVVSVIAWGSSAFGGQLLRVAERVPEMLSLAAHRLADTDPRAQALMQRSRAALQELDAAAENLADLKVQRPSLQRKLRPPAKTATKADAADEPAAPFTDGAAEALRTTAINGSGMLLRFASDLTIVLFVAFFLLSGGAALTERFLGLWGDDPVRHRNAAHALAECARQVRIYAAVLLVTNAIIGLAVWAAFAWSGLPDASGWGVTAAVLHVVPYLGMALLTALGAAEAFLAHGTLGAALGVAGFVVLLSTVIGTLVAAWLQSRAARMNPAAVFIGLVFWGALWGVWGLFLGPVLIVLIKVVAEHTRSGQRLAFLLQG